MKIQLESLHKRLDASRRMVDDKTKEADDLRTTGFKYKAMDSKQPIEEAQWDLDRMEVESQFS